jgi:short-subunit dehydrogenase
MRRSIDGMAVIITGASAGIGRALARELAPLGARLALTARRLDRLEELNKELGGGHLVIRADVAIEADCERLVRESAERFGRIDTLVCNAGYGFLSTVAQTSAECMRAIFQTNVFGTTNCISAAVPIMKRQEPRDGWRGQLMIVSSAVARRAIPFFGAYSATKAAQLSLAEALRVELKTKRIAVSSVHPIGTSTDFFEVSAKLSGRRSARIPGEIIQTPEQVAAAMRHAIERPRPEVWPFRLARIGLGLSALVPGLTDRVLSRRGSQMSGEDGRRNANDETHARIPESNPSDAVKPE